ncbi:arylsulfatase [Paenibacillus flagellatus]|uniref:Arylsulfatase n=1 Tax=Paenibacillus flagellatus TaxID=2211139 RepID=A0A2V5KJX0_9BACL|nr:arylsulfatase [Paenibacillus flagellatus]PYI50777.1 arylsulfatase [Paenibacillus flagellatus]
MTRTNVLLLMTDQQRADSVGCFGSPVVETPNLDWLASQGTIFTQAYTPSPSCIPARAALLTGQKPWNTGILGMGRGQGPMGVGFAHTLPGELAKAGYHTQGVGKMHFYPQRTLNGFHHTVLDESGREEDPGFVSDYRKWFQRHKDGDYDITDHGIGWNSWMARPYHAPEHLHPTNWTVNESIEFLKRRDPAKPFFLKTSFARPHSPYDAPAYYFDLYANGGKAIPAPYKGEWASMHDDPEEAARPDAWRGVRSDEEIRRARAGYYGSITHIDHQIGRLLTYMQKIGELDRTLIVFVSDHGDMLGDHNLWRKTYAYDGSARVPLIVRPPRAWGKPARAVVDTPAVLQDLMPTVLDFLGLPIPDTVDGISLKPLMEGKSVGREYIHGEHSTCYSEEQEMQYMTDGKRKYVWLPRIGREQLFDISRDFREERDLSADGDWREELDVWRKRLVAELEPRGAGLTDGGRLVSQAGKPFLVSPRYRERLEASPYKWMS